jgi:hypothetical protein
MRAAPENADGIEDGRPDWPAGRNIPAQELLDVSRLLLDLKIFKN